MSTKENTIIQLPVIVCSPHMYLILKVNTQSSILYQSSYIPPQFLSHFPNPLNLNYWTLDQEDCAMEDVTSYQGHSSSVLQWTAQERHLGFFLFELEIWTFQLVNQNGTAGSIWFNISQIMGYQLKNHGIFSALFGLSRHCRYILNTVHSMLYMFPSTRQIPLTSGCYTQVWSHSLSNDLLSMEITMFHSNTWPHRDTKIYTRREISYLQAVM